MQARAASFRDVRIELETGVRDTGLYDVVVSLDLVCGVEPVVVKRTKKPASEHRVLRTIEELLAEHDTLRSVLVDEEHVVLRWSRNVALERIEDAEERVVET